MEQDTPQIPFSIPSVDSEWLTNYHQFLASLLSKIIKQDDNIKLLLSEEMMNKYWVKAVTSDTYGASQSYEELEIIGDNILHSVFNMYVFKRFPSSNKDMITNMNHYYMSWRFQPTLTRSLGFDKFIRAPEIDDKMREDIFEAFFGALYETSRVQANEGRAYANCMNMITVIFNDVEIDDNVAAAKSVVQQNISRLGYGNVWVLWQDQDGNRIAMGKKVDTRGTDGIYRLSIMIPRNAVNYLESKGIKIKSKYGPYTGTVKNIVDKEAYDDVFNHMKSAGLTKKWVDNEVSVRHGTDDEAINRSFKDIMDKVKKRGYDDFSILSDRVKKDATYGYITLRLIKRDKNSVKIEERPIESIKYFITQDPLENMQNFERSRRELVAKFISE